MIRGKSSRNGAVLVVVVVVTVLLTLGALTLCQLMLAENRSARLAAYRAQDRLLAESGVEAMRVFLVQDEQMMLESGGAFNNPDLLRGVLVTDGTHPQQVGRFSVLSPLWSEDGRSVLGLRFGVEDESARINLNVLVAWENSVEGAGRAVLMQLPGMEEMTADAILDWLDEDDEQREFGAEVDIYSSLEPPYSPRNGPIHTMEELLLVQGVTEELLFGVDRNRNGLPDAGESDPLAYANVDNSDGGMTAGWAAYLTLQSKETNLSSDGSEKIYLNEEDLEELHKSLSSVLGEQQATYIVGYRQFGLYEGEDPLEPMPSGDPDFDTDPTTEITNLAQLLGGAVEMSFEGQPQKTIVASPFSIEAGEMTSYVPELLDRCTTTEEATPGKISIYSAPRMALMTIPGMTDEIADRIIAERVQDPIMRIDEDMQNVAWLLTREIVTAEEMASIMPYICSSDGAVQRMQIVGFRDSGGRGLRMEVVMDVSEQPPKILALRDMESLGRGYPLELLGVGIESNGVAGFSPAAPSDESTY
jgi:DNA uptake protein ComE-like DNA-binding protein